MVSPKSVLSEVLAVLPSEIVIIRREGAGLKSPYLAIIILTAHLQLIEP